MTFMLNRHLIKIMTWLISRLGFSCLFKWFRPAYLLVIVFFTFLWSFVCCGRDEFRVRLDNNESYYVERGVEYQTLEVLDASRNEQKMKQFDSRTMVIPLLKLYGNVLIDLPDGQRVWTDDENVRNLDMEQLDKLNRQYYYNFCGDVQKDFIGKEINDLVDCYGEYVVHIREKNIHKYCFPQLRVYNGHQVNTAGVVFETDAVGRVYKAYLWKKDKSTTSILSYFPFFETIIQWNLAYNKIVNITIQDYNGKTSVGQALVNALILFLIGLLIATFPFVVLFPYIVHYLYDKSCSNIKIKYCIAIPYFIIAYIHILNMTETVEGNEFIVFCMMTGVAVCLHDLLQKIINYNRCGHCNTFDTLTLIDSKIVNSRIESEMSTTEDVDEPINTYDRYVKVTSRYKIYHRRYIDIVQRQLFCSSCKKVTVLNEEFVRRTTRDKKLMEAFIKDYRKD